MRIKLEIHAPGLDLHQERWNHHVLFMDRVHTHVDRIAACSWQQFTASGRGALFVDADQWMTVIKGDQWTQDVLFPCGYTTAQQDDVDTVPLGAGFRQLLSGYDPESETILLVQHHPGDQLSVYLIEPLNAPPDMYEKMKDR